MATTILESGLAPAMAFAVPFAVFSVDLWRHGPVGEPLKHLGLGASLVGLAMGRYEAYLAALAVWLVLLAAAMASDAGKQEAREAGKAAAPPPQPAEQGPPPLPPQGKAKLDKAFEQFKGNLNEATNCDGKPWKLQADKDGIKVYASDFAGQSTKRWKVETTVSGASLEELMEELFDFDRRVGAGGWDTAMKEGKVLTTFKDGESLARMVTNAAAGGAISSREFFDLRNRYLGGEHPDAPEGGMMVFSVGMGKADRSWLKALPNPDKSLVLGSSFPGGGMRMVPVAGKPNTFAYTMVANLNLNGWIPTSVINSATSSALLESHQAMHDHLKKKFA